MASKSITVKFPGKDRETQNKVRFAEEGDKDSQAIGKLYLSKAASKKLGDPDSIEVVIKAT